MWVTYTLADNISEGSTIYTLLSGTRVGEDPQLEYYMRLLDKKNKINALFNTKDIAKIRNLKDSIHPHAVTNMQIKHTDKECHKTSRMTIVENPGALDGGNLLFALDGRKLLYLGKKEPSYTGTLYLDDKYMSIMKSFFDSTWNSAESLNLEES
jgi:hypothetical protein